MPISMTCPQCGARFSFTDENRGKKAHCQRCQQVFTIEEPTPEVAAYPDLELVEPLKPAPAPPPSKPQPRPASPPVAPRKKETSANDFDPAAMGLSFDTGGKEEQSRPASRPPRKEEKKSSGDLFDDYKDEEEEPRSSRKRNESGFDRGQSAGEDKTAASTSGGKRFPFWLRLVIFFAGFLIPGVKEISGLIGDGSENPIERMKRRVKQFVIIAAIGIVLLCGGLATMMFVMARR